jgi:hypothetical protein
LCNSAWLAGTECPSINNALKPRATKGDLVTG